MRIDPAASEYLDHLRTTAAHSTWLYDRFRLLRFFRWLTAGERDWRTLRRPDLEVYLLTINDTADTRYKACNALRGFYAYHRHLSPPTDGIAFRASPRHLPHVPAQSIVERAISAINSPVPEVAHRNRLMVELAYGSGLRRCELSRLDIGDVDLTNRTAYVRGKGGATRIVPITGRTVAATRAYLAHRPSSTGPLFTSTTVRRRLSLVRISTEFKRCTGHNTHLFRHACATHMLQNGCSIRLIGELLGHRFLTTTQRYTHIDRGALSRIVNAHHPRSEHSIQPQENTCRQQPHRSTLLMAEVTEKL